MLSLFECITGSSSLFLEDIKSIAIANSICRVSDFFRSFMLSFRYGLILLTYSSVDSVLFVLPLFSYLLLQKLPSSVFAKKFLISITILSFIASFSFFSLKKFLMSLIVLSSISFFSLKDLLHL